MDASEATPARVRTFAAGAGVCALRLRPGRSATVTAVPFPTLDFDPSLLRRAVTAAKSAASSKVVPTAIAWLSTAEDWADACRAWPDIAAELGTDHGSYSHRIESTMKAMSRAMPGHRFVVATLRFPDVEAELAALDSSDDSTAPTRVPRRELRRPRRQRGRDVRCRGRLVATIDVCADRGASTSSAALRSRLDHQRDERDVLGSWWCLTNGLDQR